MMFFSTILISFIAFLPLSHSQTTQTTTSQSSPIPQVIYKPNEPSSYVPHATYPFSDSYGPSFEGYLVPALQIDSNNVPTADYNNGGIITSGQAFLQTTLRIFAKVGLFLVGGVVLLLVGAVFHSLICSLSQLCTVNYHGLGGIDKDTARALLNPERVARAAVFLQDAVEKYEKMQEGAMKFK